MYLKYVLDFFIKTQFLKCNTNLNLPYHYPFDQQIYLIFII